MDIGVALRELGLCDSSELRAAILALDETDWAGTTRRQSACDVYPMPDSIVLVCTDGGGWPELEVRRGAGWSLLAEQAVPLMHRIIESHYAPGGTLIRALAARLPAGGITKPRRDKHTAVNFSHRVHIPIQTNPHMRFMIDGRPCQLDAGKVYEIDNQRTHSAINKGGEDCIHFIFDYVPPQHLGREVANA